jgi:hypothetical protein
VIHYGAQGLIMVPTPYSRFGSKNPGAIANTRQRRSRDLRPDQGSLRFLYLVHEISDGLSQFILSASGDYHRFIGIRGSSLARGRFALRDKRFSASIKAENSIAA